MVGFEKSKTPPQRAQVQIWTKNMAGLVLSGVRSPVQNFPQE